MDGTTTKSESIGRTTGDTKGTDALDPARGRDKKDDVIEKVTVMTAVEADIEVAQTTNVRGPDHALETDWKDETNLIGWTMGDATNESDEVTEEVNRLVEGKVAHQDGTDDRLYAAIAYVRVQEYIAIFQMRFTRHIQPALASNFD